MYTSVMFSSDDQGLARDSERRGGATELRKGTRTDSSMSSYMILTARSSSAASGGVNSVGRDNNRSRTLDGRLTSLGPLGVMYASISFRHNIRTYSQAGLVGDIGVSGSFSTILL